MDKKVLDQADKETLTIELTNSVKGRLRNIKISIGTMVTGLILFLAFYNLNLGQLGTAATLISIIIFAYGLFNTISWFFFSRATEKLENDINKGVKLSGQVRILGYNFLTRKITLDNGLKIDAYEIRDRWTTGDLLYIEQLPTSDFILKCEKNER